MRIPSRWFGLLLSLCLFVPKGAAAADIAVFAPEISNLSPQDADAVGVLIAQSYASVSQLAVLPPAQAAPALAQAGDYPAAAAQLGVKEYIRLSAAAAGRRIVITAGRYQTDGRSLMQLRQTAESIEDLAPAADSIARALHSGVAQPSAPLAPLAPPPPIASRPLTAPRKRAEGIYGIKTGVHFPFAKKADYYTAVSLQFNGRIQMQRVFLEFGAGFLLPTTINDNDDWTCVPSTTSGGESCGVPETNRGHVGGIIAELGASYFLTETNFAPYVGGGIIPRVILAGIDGAGDEQDVASMSVYAQVGMTFPRDRTTRFFVDLRLAQAVLEQHLQNGREVWPTEPSLHAGIGW